MTFDWSFRRREKKSAAEASARVEAALRELSDAVSEIAKNQFQLTALVESQAETVEEAAESISGSLAWAGEKRNEEESRQQEEKTLAAILREFLPVVDGLDRIAAFVNQNREIKGLSFGPSLVEGLSALAHRTAQALAALGVRRLPAAGQPFDPHRHHAVKAVAVTDPELDGQVLEEITAGYEVRGRMLRHATVVVAVKKEQV